MARYEDGKVTLVQDGKDVETLSWDVPNERETLMRYADGGKWKLDNDDKITSWKNSAEALEKNKDTYDKVMGIAGRLQRIKNGEETADALVAELEAEGIQLTQKQIEGIDEDDLDPVTKKLTDEMKKMSGTIKTLEAKLSQNELGLFNTQTVKASEELVNKYSGKNGYPKYDQKDIDSYINKNGDRGIWHPDVKKQFELIYKDINEDKILKAERELGGMTEAQRKKIIEDAQGIRGGGAGIEPTPFKPVPGDRNMDAAAKAILENMEATGQSLEIED